MKKLLQKEKIITKESIRNYAKRSDFEADCFMYNEHAATVKLQQMGIYEASSESDIIISKLLGRISATVDLQIEKMIQSFRNNLSSINISDSQELPLFSQSPITKDNKENYQESSQDIILEVIEALTSEFQNYLVHDCTEVSNFFELIWSSVQKHLCDRIGSLFDKIQSTQIAPLREKIAKQK